MTFESCYRAHREDVYRIALRYGGGRLGWAEDVTHDVFIKLLEHLPHLAQEQDVGGWLYRVATNLCISRLRRDSSIIGWFRRALGDEGEEAAPSVQLLFEQRESAAAALATLRSLPAQERVVLCMKLLDGKEQKQIAETLSLSEGYVSKLLARAWKKIRAAGWEADDVEA